MSKHVKAVHSTMALLIGEMYIGRSVFPHGK